MSVKRTRPGWWTSERNWPTDRERDEALVTIAHPVTGKTVAPADRKETDGRYLAWADRVRREAQWDEQDELRDQWRPYGLHERTVFALMLAGITPDEVYRWRSPRDGRRRGSSLSETTLRRAFAAVHDVGGDT